MTNDLRIADAPLLVDVSGEEKLPTGGYGNYSTTINQIADFTQLKWKLATEGYVNNEINVVTNKLNNHTQDKKNPHEVTKEQVGLGEVDNTADLDKPVSAYQRTAIDEKIAKTSIVDNLTTNDSTKVLSAKQGKVLQDTKANKSEVYTKEETLTLEREDKYVITESGRTQREKNKDSITPLDYKATGDGVTDDTQAFVNLEKDYQGQVIDLLGKTYLVTKAFKSNNYINGSFSVLGSTIQGVGEQRFIRTPVTPHNCMPLLDANDISSSVYLRLQETVFFRLAVQSLVVDDINRAVYTSQETETGEMVICKHSMDNGEYSTVTDGQAGTTLFAHSGLGIDHLSNKEVHLWTGGKAVGDDRSNSVKAIRWKPKLVPYTTDIYTTVDDSFEKQEFILFDTPAKYENMIISTSYDQKWLIALNRNVVKYGYLFRFWDLQMLVEHGAGDYREKYAFDIVTKNANYYGDIKGYSKPQGTACDGQFFYTIGGGLLADDPTDPACVMNVWDLQGNLVGYNLDVDVAEKAMTDYAGSADPKTREIEGMCFARVNGVITPLIHFAGARNSETGDGEDSVTRAQWLVALGHSAPIYSNTERTGKPAYISKSSLNSLDYAVSRNYRGTSGSLKLGTVRKDGAQYKLLDLSNEGHRSITTTSGDNLTLSYGTGEIKDVATFITGASTTGVQLKDGISWHFQNSQGTSMWRFNPDGLFRPSVNNTNDFGHSSYRIKKGWFSAINIGNPPVYADNATAKAGGLVAGDPYRTSTGVLMVVY